MTSYQDIGITTVKVIELNAITADNKLEEVAPLAKIVLAAMKSYVDNC